MLKSVHNPLYSHLTDVEVSRAYLEAYKARNPDTMTDQQLDDNDSLLFWLDDELCARGLALPC